MSYEQTNHRLLRRALSWSFSLRLSLYFVIIFMIGALCLLLGGYHLISTAFENREVDLVEERLQEYKAWYEQGGIGALWERFDAQSRRSPDVMFLRVALINGYGQMVSSPGSESLLKPEAVEKLPPYTRQTGLHLGGDSHEHLWAVASIKLNDGKLLQAGKSLHSGEAVLEQFKNAFFIVMIAAVIFGVVGGTLLTHKAITPIRTLIGTIQGILRTGDLRSRAKPLAGCHELNILVDLFNRLLDRQEKLIDRMHTSLDSVAHDLRTPMARLRATAESALQQPESEARSREALADCLEESDHLIHLLNTLMELSEAEAGALRLHLESVSILAIMRKVVELYEFVAEDRHIELTIETDEPAELKADRARLQQLFANLVDNAIKFSPDNTRIKLGAIQTGDRIIAWVRDQGPGISESEQGRIWERLYRGDRSRSAQAQGVGLGLSFVKAIADAHGASVRVESRPGLGSKFVVEFPRTLALESPGSDAEDTPPVLAEPFEVR